MVLKRIRSLSIYVEDSLNMHRTASNEKILVYDILNVINKEHVIIVAGPGQKLIPVLSYELC